MSVKLSGRSIDRLSDSPGLDLPDVLVEVEKCGSYFDELLAVPEHDDWIYSDGKSTFCITFILEMYKEGGLLDPISSSIQVAEFTNNASCLPKWCKDNNDVKLPHCQILGKYRMELPGYNTMEPYPHTKEHCSSLRDCVQSTIDQRTARTNILSVVCLLGMTWCNDPRICDKVHFKYICKERECDSSLSSL
ncbi:hypothetical protein F2Q68_00031919 [Brassica cretica]|uniref:Uncharacterized protein n=2 Tax=Brassica cretica TaxID=69181 RepID=A0A8S9GKC0_BRACR|nr:hypothetical protein F2Q68_00031919 [Brassica cretica]